MLAARVGLRLGRRCSRYRRQTSCRRIFRHSSTDREVFGGSAGTQPQPISEEGIAAALKVLRSGNLHRYGATPGNPSEVALLEEELAAAMGTQYALAVASGGYAIVTALRALGVGPGDEVLTNAWTLAPVPGAVAAVGAVPVMVEVTEGLVLDLDDLAAKAAARPECRVVLVSHMRGHMVDMDRLMAVCDRAGLKVIEDCAHTMGARWGDRLSGTWGAIGCYSTQTYKHVNSGEGGLMVSNDSDAMAKAVVYSGSYMMYGTHSAAPPPSAFETIRLETPNISGRMDNLRAAILRPQLRELATDNFARNLRYKTLEESLRGTRGMTLIERPSDEHYVGSSFQFLLLDCDPAIPQMVLDGCGARGVSLQWFGGAEVREIHLRKARFSPK